MDMKFKEAMAYGGYFLILSWKYLNNRVSIKKGVFFGTTGLSGKS